MLVLEENQHAKKAPPTHFVVDVAPLDVVLPKYDVVYFHGNM